MTSGRGVLRELLATFPGKAGAALLLVLVAFSIFALVHFPLDWGSTQWSDPARWADNPKAVPPFWANWFPGSDRVKHQILDAQRPTIAESSGAGEVRTYVLPADFTYDRPPTFTSFAVSAVTFADRPPVLTISIVRPDGTEVTLLRQAVRGPREDERPPYHRFTDEPLRIVLTSDPSVIAALRDFFRDQYNADVPLDTIRNNGSLALFGTPDTGTRDSLRVLPGRYELRLTATVSNRSDQVGPVRFVVGGSVFGLMGTDAVGRDLAQGLLFGLPIALIIGIVASVIVTAIGVSLGVISGYVGGKTDLAIQRMSDVVNNIPLLPLLIFFVFVVGSNLWLIVLFLVAFSWPGLTILIRSMVLQIRTGQLVESAVTLGASKWRIMARHIFPQIAPFVIAQMIFFAPAAILSEAGLSFLGLGDPSIPTWGQILESGFRTGAVFLGYWWWVIPPGVLIIITALTFMFLSLGMEPVVNPRLRRVRN